MNIRLAHIDEIECIMAIFEAAKSYMRATGNATQWDDDYPSRRLICSEIMMKHFYCIENNGCVVGVFSFIVGDEPTYAEISEGKWRYVMPYGVIHRLASNGSVRGVADACFRWCKSQHDYLRADTHRDNKTMLQILHRQGFVRSGVITLARDGSRRIAYEWKR